jgi:hypothetical protein
MSIEMGKGIYTIYWSEKEIAHYAGQIFEKFNTKTK